MSVLTRKQAVDNASGLRAQAAAAARQVGPLASKTVPLAQQAALQAQQAAQQAQLAALQAMPFAKSAGMSMRQGADEAIARATPVVDAARSWVAPQLEQSAHAISESLAPMISSALISASRKIDAPERKKPRGSRAGKVAGMLLLTTAAAAAAALVAMRLRQRSGQSASMPPADTSSGELGPDSAGSPGAETHGQGAGPDDDGGPPDPDMNGHPRIV